MPRGGRREGAGRPPDPRALLREAGWMLAGAGAVLERLATDGRPLALQEIEASRRSILRYAQASCRRLLKVTKILRERSPEDDQTPGEIDDGSRMFWNSR